MKKIHKIVMVTSKEEAKVNSIIKRESDNRLATVNVLTVDDPNKHLHTTQHLYILSDEEIKDNDWFINGDEIYNKISDYDNDQDSYDCWIGDSLNGYASYRDNCKKIIATTNKELKTKEYFDGILSLNKIKDIFLPSLSELFIKIYIAEYNIGNIIKEVELEYDSEEKPAWSGMWVDSLKLREDNTVIIDLVEEKKYTKEEVSDIIKQAFFELVQIEDSRKMNDWIKNNI